MDTAVGWIEGVTAAHPLWADALADGSVLGAARNAVDGWEGAWTRRVAELRWSPPVSAQRWFSYGRRTAAQLYCTLRSKHAVIATFTATQSGLQRWHRWAIIMTTLVVALSASP